MYIRTTHHTHKHRHTLMYTHIQTHTLMYTQAHTCAHKYTHTNVHLEPSCLYRVTNQPGIQPSVRVLEYLFRALNHKWHKQLQCETLGSALTAKTG